MTIIIDSKEASKQQPIVDALRKLCPDQVFIEALPVGDFRIVGEEGEVLIERKTSADLMGSWADSRLFDQLVGLKSVEGVIPMILVEGSVHLVVKFRHWNRESVVGILASLAAKWKIQMIPIPSKQYTILFLVSMNMQMGKTKKGLQPLRYKPKHLKPHEEVRLVVEGFPDIGPAIGDRILKHFKTLRNFITHAEQVDEVDGVGEKLKAGIMRVVDYPYEVDSGGDSTDK